MSFSLVYSEEAGRQLRKLDKAVVRRVIKKLESTVETPYHFFEALGDRPEYRLRVGDYRVIVNLDGLNKVIIVRSIGHRRDVYKKH